jgi:hypothetical protein
MFWVKEGDELRVVKIPKTLRLTYLFKKRVGLYTTKRFRAGDKVFRFKFRLRNEREAPSGAIEIAENQYMDAGRVSAAWFINHSCDANTKLVVDLDKRSAHYEAIRDIPAKSEVTFNYLTVDWDMEDDNDVINCHCKSRNCVGLIRGFKFLSAERKLELQPYLSELLKGRLG